MIHGPLKSLTWTIANSQTKWFTFQITIALNIDTFSWCAINNIVLSSLAIITSIKIIEIICIAASSSITQPISSHRVDLTWTCVDPWRPWYTRCNIRYRRCSIRYLCLRNNFKIMGVPGNNVPDPIEKSNIAILNMAHIRELDEILPFSQKRRRRSIHWPPQ